MGSFFDDSLPRAVRLHELKFLTLSEQWLFGGVSRACRSLSEEVMRQCETISFTHNVDVSRYMPLVSGGNFRKLRSVSLEGGVLEFGQIHTLMQHCPKLTHFEVDFTAV